MSNENRSELIHDALNLLDEDMIEDVDRLRGNAAETVEETKKIKKVPWRRWTALAASICVLVIGGWAWQNFQKQNLDYEADKENKEDFLSNQEDGKEKVTESDDRAEDANDVVIDGEPPNIEEENSTGEKEDPQPPKDHSTEVGSYASIRSLKDNYVQVSVIPHKVWESAASEEDAMQQAVVIDAKYKEDMDKLVEAMCAGNGVLTEELPESDPDMIYHLFFERADGEIIHCWLLEDGFLYDHEAGDWSVALDRDVYGNTFKILALHW